MSHVAALYRDIPIFEYAPKKIKMATIRGTASKERPMLKSILNIKEMPKHLDASDGFSRSCHYFQRSKNKKKTIRDGRIF